MKAASFDETKVILKNNDDKFLAKGSVLTFEGYKKIYGVYEKSKLENIPTFIKDNLYKINKVSIDEHKNKPPYPYTEASIIKTMEEVGIGRPSTYASTLESLKKSAYITQEKKYIKPTSTGVKADEKLQEYFSDIIDVKYTANMEKDLDLIAEGEVKSLDILNDFYKPFISKVTYAYNNMKNPDIIYTDEKCPKCDGRLVKKHGRYGEYTHCENRPDCDYIKPKEVTHDEKLKKCPVCGGNLVLREGKYGKFYGCSNYPKCGHTMKIYRVTKKTKKEN
jgi:DNA topoisomerase-1